MLPGKPGCPHHRDFRGFPRARARGVPALPPRLDKGTGGRAVGTKEALAMNIVNLVGRLAK
ncbi:hypothetical protein, partial [Blastomonas sp. CCH1-A6]|uniref:hypothetical protein n=1 Tax=Blastomonas sp. CCH1-A6 TaxID=1768762 RepID=UPI001E29B07E